MYNMDFYHKFRHVKGRVWVQFDCRVDYNFGLVVVFLMKMMIDRNKYFLVFYVPHHIFIIHHEIDNVCSNSKYKL